MPGRSPDQGVKRFELRTGVGGLPTLGGMFRSGDPATTPPHKFHLLVNMRKTPGGTITRPGLTLEYDTGIQECIDGLTEDSGLQGAGILLYPGADQYGGNGEEIRNAASFRSVFPDQSSDYSEFITCLYGPANWGANSSPVLAFALQPAGGPTFLSRPFLFRGQAVQFALVDRNGTNTVALLGMELPGRTGEQASNCQRTVDGLPDPADGCALLGDSWPWQYPVGSVGVLTYFENPFPSGTTWYPDASDDVSDGPIDLILTRQERFDDPLAATPGVNEVLYFVAWRDNGGVIERRLVRWDGVQQTTEYSTIPDDLRPALGDQAYGPYLCLGDANAGPADWASFRQADGTWLDIGGVGWVLGTGPTEFLTAFFLERGLSWRGKGQAVVYGTWDGPGANDYGGYVFCMEQGAAEFEADRGQQSCTLFYSAETNHVPIVIDAVVCGTKCYAIGHDTGYADAWYLWVGEFSAGALAAGDANAPVQLTGAYTAGALWIQAVGDRVFVGGHFDTFDPALQIVSGEAHHGVYDVTGTLHETADCVAVYRVDDSLQPEDEQTERYSRGALPAVPSDDHGGEGFQAS